MFEVFTYFFAISYYINICVTNELNIVKNKFTIKSYVKCQKMVSIYDDKLLFTNKINCEYYLKANGLTQFTKEIVQSDCNKNELTTIVMNLINNQRKINLINKDMLLIIDRTYSNTHDLIYISQYNSRDTSLNELEQNTHFIGMTFNILPNVNKVYVTYGNQQRFRFYPEHLTTIIPRLFKKSQMNQIDYLNQLYSSPYKHGFCLHLNDEEFNTYYKMITCIEHVSVNYNREYV
eukprot:172305_1